MNHRQFDAFGNLTAESDPDVEFRYAWTGRFFDADSGLQYNRARWYDATVGRWISEDPIGFGGGDANLSRYVGNGPANGTDPSGLDTYTYPETPFASDAEYAGWLRKNYPVGESYAPPTSFSFSPFDIGKNYLYFTNEFQRFGRDLGLMTKYPLETFRGAKEGRDHGLMMVFDAATFHQSPIHQMAERTIAENGGAYSIANVSAHVGVYTAEAVIGYGIYQAGPAMLAYGNAYAPAAVTVAGSPAAWALGCEVFVGSHTDWDPAAMAMAGLMGYSMAPQFPTGNAPNTPLGRGSTGRTVPANLRE